MEKALSLKTNSIIFAKDVNYEMSKRITPVCPECKEPVHLRKKFMTTGTAYFAHHVHKGEKEAVCSLRVFTYWDQPHTNSGMWASRGQLIEKIQIELISFFSDQFSEEKDKVTNSIRELIHEYRNFGWIYTDLLEHLADADHIYNKVREETTLGNDEGREIVSHYNIAIACLNGAKLHMATQGLLWCAFIVAYSMSDVYEKNPDPAAGVICDGVQVDFSLDPQKFRSLIAGKASYPTKRNHIYYRCVSISQRLLLRLLTSWRHPNSLRRNFLSVCGDPKLIEANVNKSSAKRYDWTPTFRTLDERIQWQSKQRE